MLSIGTRVGDYDILDIHDQSKTGVVYRVRNQVAGRLEALKVLPESLQTNTEALERFFREIKVHARLMHPNIAAFYNATQIGTVVVMTTEFIEGTALASILQAGPLPPATAVSYLTQVLAALSHAHSQNVVHREVTPENIYILEGGRVKLGGFGLAKGKGEMNLTQEGTTLGPVHYISPEQVKGTTELDPRSDIYSAGCVLYEMLTGRKPFNAKSQFDVMLAHVQRDPMLAGTVNRNIPAHWSFVIAKAMEKKPSERYPTASAFAAALEDALSRPGQFTKTAATPPAPLAPGPAQTAPAMAHPSAPDQTFTWLLVAFVAAAIVFAFLLLAR